VTVKGLNKTQNGCLDTAQFLLRLYLPDGEKGNCKSRVSWSWAFITRWTLSELDLRYQGYKNRRS